MNLDNFTEDQKQRVQECTNAEEIMAFIREEGIELTVEQLEAVSGGLIAGWFPHDVDPKLIWKNMLTGVTH